MNYLRHLVNIALFSILVSGVVSERLYYGNDGLRSGRSIERTPGQWTHYDQDGCLVGRSKETVSGEVYYDKNGVRTGRAVALGSGKKAFYGNDGLRIWTQRRKLVNGESDYYNTNGNRVLKMRTNGGH